MKAAYDLIDRLEDIWRPRLERHLGRMCTESEWKLARKEIAMQLQNDLEMGLFDT